MKPLPAIPRELEHVNVTWDPHGRRWVAARTPHRHSDRYDPEPPRGDHHLDPDDQYAPQGDAA